MLRSPLRMLTPVITADEKITVQPPPAPMEERLTIQPVILVPRMDPRIMLTACLNSIRPEFTKPIAITLVAEEDCIKAVTPTPNTIPLNGLLVSL